MKERNTTFLISEVTTVIAIDPLDAERTVNETCQQLDIHTFDKPDCVQFLQGHKHVKITQGETDELSTFL